MGLKETLKKLEQEVKEIPLLPKQSEKLRKTRKEIEEKFASVLNKDKKIKKKRGGMVKKFSSGGAATRGLGKVIK
jgi:hypothetical protein|tara:strand:+ start:278 stop:502 length:225 start_codon:yes stop_codon:yes gene_type:complete